MKKLLTFLLFAAMLQIGTAQDSLLIIDVHDCNEAAFFEGCGCICHLADHTKCSQDVDSCGHHTSCQHAQVAAVCSLCGCGKQALNDSLAAAAPAKTAEELFFHGLGRGDNHTILYNTGHFHCAECTHLCSNHCMQNYYCIYPIHSYGSVMDASDAKCDPVASPQLYELFVSQSTYSPLSGAKVLIRQHDWDELESVQFTPPFPIFVNGHQVLAFEFDLFFDALTGLFADPDYFIDFVPIEADIIDRGFYAMQALSAIQYQTTGHFGNRILKIEWKNVASENEHPHRCNHLDNYLNYQLWFYEAGQHIEFRYGPSSKNPIQYFTSEPKGVFAGLYGTKQLGLSEIAISGPPQSPTLACDKGLLWDIPAAGTVYRLSPQPKLGRSASDLLATSLEVKQDLRQDVVQVKATGGSSQLQLFNLQGQLLLEGALQEQQGSLSLAGLPAGLYLLRQVGNPQAARVVKH